MSKKSWFNIKALAKNEAEISIYDEIGGWGISSKDFAISLKEVGDVNHIALHLNTPGGSVFEGMAIYNVLKSHKATVTVYVDGLAASMGSVIAMAGDVVVMPENALMMIHNPWSMAAGDAEELRKNAELLDKIKSQMINLYSSKTGQSDATISALMDDETWLTGSEAVELGFADELADAVEIAASFDLSKFGNTPKNLLAVASNIKDQHEETAMSKEKATDKPVEKEVDVSAIQAQALKAEQDRVSGINAAFEGFAAHQELAMKCVMDQKCSVADAQAKLLTALGSNQEPVGGRPVTTEDTGAKASLGAMSDILALRTGRKTDNDVGENPYRGSSLQDMCRATLENRGVSTKGMDKMNIVGSAMTHSSSDFPKLLENSLGKILQASYGNFPETWRSIADVGQVSDFKQNSRIRLGSFNSLETIQEGGEYTNGTFGEESETIQASTKGKMISITRQAIINDDLNGFTRLAQMLGRAAQRTIGNDVYGVITANAAMSDGFNLFSTEHNNLAGTGGAMTIATVGAARAAMRKQKDVNGNDFLNIAPSLLVVPVALEDAANTLMASQTDPAQSNSRKPNIYQNAFTVISDPRLDDNSATAWYLLADPALVPTVEVAFLDGNENPYLEMQEGFTVDGMQWKVRLDYGVAATDFRGSYKNAGA